MTGNLNRFKSIYDNVSFDTIVVIVLLSFTIDERRLRGTNWFNGHYRSIGLPADRWIYHMKVHAQLKKSLKLADHDREIRLNSI